MPSLDRIPELECDGYKIDPPPSCLEKTLGIGDSAPDLESLLHEWNTTQLVPIPRKQDPSPEMQTEMIRDMDPAVRTWFRAWLLDIKRKEPIGVENLPLGCFMSFRGLVTGEDPEAVEGRIDELRTKLRYQLVGDRWAFPTPVHLTPDALVHELQRHPTEAFSILSRYITHPIVNLRVYGNSPHRKVQSLIAKWMLEKVMETGQHRGEDLEGQYPDEDMD